MTAKVLIIEDSKDTHALVGFHLRKEDWTLVHAYDGTSGLKMAHDLRPTLILMDLDLPDITGVDACKQLQDDPLLKKVPVIFISSHSNVLQIAQALDAGGVDYITKPFNPVDIRARIRAGIRSKLNADKLEETIQRLQDASERDIRRTRELLLQAENMATVGNLVTTIGKELAGPTEFVRSAIQSVRQEHATIFQLNENIAKIDDDAARNLYNVITESQAKIERFIDETDIATTHMLAVSQVLSHQGRADLSASPDISIEDILDESLIICRSRLENISISKSLLPTPTITCRRSQIGQVLIKLLSHSSTSLQEDVAPGNREIQITTRSAEHEANDGIQIQLSHNGKTSQTTEINNIFSPQGEIDFTVSDSSIGLALCKEIIEEHGGNIAFSVHTETSQHHFDIWLPLTPPQ